MTITSLGIHRVKHGDVNHGIADLMQGDRAAIMYTDPPWGDGTIKFFHTLNKKQTGADVAPVPLATFLDSVFHIARDYCDGFLCVEYGQKWADEIQAMGRSAGFQPHGIVDIQYRSGGGLLPLHLHLFARSHLSYPPGYADGVRGKVGYACTSAAIGPLAALTGGIILDPCCGMGYTAQAALDHGLAFRGNELNAARLAKTIKRLAP